MLSHSSKKKNFITFYIILYHFLIFTNLGQWLFFSQVISSLYLFHFLFTWNPVRYLYFPKYWLQFATTKWYSYAMTWVNNRMLSFCVLIHHQMINLKQLWSVVWTHSKKSIGKHDTLDECGSGLPTYILNEEEIIRFFHFRIIGSIKPYFLFMASLSFPAAVGFQIVHAYTFLSVSRYLPTTYLSNLHKLHKHNKVTFVTSSIKYLTIQLGVANPYYYIGTTVGI